MNLINIENLTKVYTERKLFDNTSFSLQDGEKVGISCDEAPRYGLLC